VDPDTNSDTRPAMAPDRPRRRALVLGGGGATGNAWCTGVVAGLLDAGLDVTAADLVVGTSSGSTTAAVLTSADPAELHAATLTAATLTAATLTAATLTAAPVRRPGPPAGPAAAGPGPVGAAAAQMERTAAVIAAAHDPADMRRRLGAAALELARASDGSRQARWRETVAARLPSEHWPEQLVVITAVDAVTGDPVVLDRSSGVDLVDAVAASCSSGPAYAIGDRWYIDGGYRTNAENADLAAGYDQVLVLSPFGGRSRTPAAWGLDLATQVQALRAGGSAVEVVVPEPGAELVGARAVDVALRPAAARAGHEQGRALAGRLARSWR
jgi:NTE family protein